MTGTGIGIVVSRADRASAHIGDHLIDLADWTAVGDDHFRTDGFELRIYDDLHLHLEGVAADFDDPAFLVFVSRHSGDTGPLLSTHFTGNLGPAEFGGEDHTLAETCPNAQRTVLAALTEHAPAGYDVSLECTHHGPSDPGAPSMFVELGSEDAQWDDPAGAAAVARAVLDLRGIDPAVDRTVVAFGDPHYAPRPTRIVRETAWAVGHVASDWALDDLGTPSEHPGVVAQVFDRSDARYALVEGDRPDLESTIATLGFRVVGETWVRETDGVPLELVEELERELVPVDDGLRFGEPTSDAARGGYSLVELPAELVADANGVDAAAITDAARATSVAYETRENGTRVTGRAAFISERRYDDFVDSACDVLATKYDRVERGADEVVVHERAFDPERAAELGVPEGPKFGRLARGESVTVDDRTVHPADVTVERTRRYPR